MQFKQINKKNQAEIENLSIKDEQEGFLESVKQCLLDASKNPEWVCAGIYEKDTHRFCYVWNDFIDYTEKSGVDRSFYD